MLLAGSVFISFPENYLRACKLTQSSRNSIISVSGTMIGYLQWRGFSAGSIALLKGICTGAELLGTIAMPVLTRYLGLVRAGAWCIWFEVLTLTPVLFSIYSSRLPVQAFIFGKADAFSIDTQSPRTSYSDHHVLFVF